MFEYLFVNMRMLVFGHLCVCGFVLVKACVCLCICVYLCVCVRERKREREKDRGMKIRGSPEKT